jgi:predicted amidohydrolase YtcJ
MEAEQVPSPLVLWGPIYTMNPSAPWAEAVVILEGRIAFVGSKEGSQEYLTADAKVIDVSSLPEGGLILPGFQDAHVHPLSGMIIEQSCDMARCGGLEPALALIEEYAADHPEMEWIVGGGWDMSWFPDGLSLASVLDRVMPDRPAVFRRVDGHAVWANTAAMKAIDVYHKDFPDPPHGRIDKDPHTGLPIGSFQEQVVPFRLRSLSPSASDHSPCGDQTRYRPEICFRSTSRRSPWRPVSRRWSSA